MLAALVACETGKFAGASEKACTCCFCALWLNWRVFVYVASPEKEKSVLLAGIMVSGVLFLLQIRFVNPEAWRDLWTR
jgi:hypothetical protein